MSQCIIKRLDYSIAAKGRNLRIIGDYARKTSGWPSAPAVIHANPGSTMLLVWFADGAACCHEFADALILAQYVKDKIRNSRGRFIAYADRDRYEYPAGTFSGIRS
jgi:hypothetical protein